LPSLSVHSLGAAAPWARASLAPTRERLASELSAKENQLRGLVLESEQIQQGIRELELRAQNLTNEQTNLQREILERKQAQRYLLEQDKLREKNTSKFKKSFPGVASREQKEESSSIES